jgi:GAF domain-containing protein
MEPTFKLSQTTDKTAAYEEFIENYRPFVEGEKNLISILANTAAALREAFGFFWIGFYLTEGEWMHLGPFQGSVACYRIRKGRGVCGTAWSECRTIVVPDVDKFPGHIACSSLSRSEIVVPLFKEGAIIGVLDIDSDKLNMFDEDDRKGLEAICEFLCQQVY